MANNTTLPVGAGGDVIADEDIGGVKYQQVKLIDSTATSTSPTGIAAKPLQVSLANHAANSVAVKTDGSATTQPVSLATNTPTLQAGSTTAVTQATGTNLHTVIDSGTVTTVSTVTNLSQLGGTAVAMNTGARSAGTQRVTIATDDVVPAAQSGTWTVQPGNTANTTAWKITQAASASSSATLQSAVAVTGNGATLSTDGMSSVVFTVSGTFVATITFEGTEDGTNYTSLSVVQIGTNTISSTTTTAGVYEAPVAGLVNVRGRVTWTSGTSVTVTAHAVPVNYNGKVINANITSGQTIAVTQGTASNLKVDLSGTSANTTAIKVDGSAVTQPVSLSGNQATNTVQLGGTSIDTNSGNKSAGTQRVVLATDQPNLTTPLNTNSIAQATGGYTPAKLISAATTNATVIKASAGTLGTLSIGNISASARYVKFYNKATSPTVGTDVPVQVYVVPGNAAGAGTNIPIPAEGLNFSTGISFAITAGIADTDTTAVGANEVVVSYGTA